MAWPLTATRSSSRAGSSPAATRLPISPPSSFCHTTTSSGWRSAVRDAASVRATSMAASVPSVPS
jgi:hypothetical protein